MPASKAPPGEGASGNFTHIGNKVKRQELYRKHRKDKRQEKLKKRVEQAKEERGEEGKEKKRVSGQFLPKSHGGVY